MGRPKWLRNLDTVETTVEQARVILRRNKALRSRLQTLERNLEKTGKPPKGWHCGPLYAEGHVHIGCPHCIAANSCSQCAWDKYPKDTFDLGALSNLASLFIVNSCAYAPLDGVTLDEVSNSAPVAVEYTRNHARIVYYHHGWSGGKRALDASIRRAYRFLNAHIRWAEDVIQRKARGG